MSYEAPDAAALKAKFPVFAAVEDAVIASAISEADSYVSTAWSEADYLPAYLLAAAHILTLDGHGSGTEATIHKDGLGGFKRFKSGPLELERAAGAIDVSGLKATSFGERYLRLLRRNFPAVLVV